MDFSVLKQSRAALYMILYQLFLTGTVLLSKVILKRGAFIFALLTYRQIVAIVFLAPLAFFMERGMHKKLTWSALIWIFFNGLFGSTMGIGLYYYGLRQTSATYASTFSNLIPVVTFLFSTMFRIETLGLKTVRGRVRIVGIILCVAGAIIIPLYRGKPLHVRNSHLHNDTSKNNTNGDMVHGFLYLVGSCLGSAAWFISQLKLFKAFPSTYWGTLLSCLAGGIQSAIIGISLERRTSAWRLGWDLNLLTIVYSGILTTGVNFCLMLWVVARQGPTYPAVFNPLLLVFVAILESLFMKEELFVGSILGMILIIGGLYAFLLGKKNQSLGASDAGDWTEVPAQAP